MRLMRVLAFGAAAPFLVSAAQPLRLEPSSAWVLDYAENSCRLIRTFGEGPHKAVLSLESEAPGEMDMLVAGKDLEGYTEEVPARFLPVQAKPLKGRTAVTVTSGQPAILWSKVYLLPDALAEKLQEADPEKPSRLAVRPPPIDLSEQAQLRAARLEFASHATEIEIDARRSRPVLLETGPMDEAMKAFQKCSRDSLRDWGVDPDVDERIVRRVWPINLQEWFSSDDYPKNMLIRGEESEVKVRLLVDASGRVTKCTSLSHFNAPDFNEIVCANLTRRARFAPAELADGTRVPSYYVNTVAFRIAR